MTTEAQRRPLRLFIVTGEHSGDALGASLIRELRRRGYDGTALEIYGVGGELLAGQGLVSLFPQSDIAVIGVAAVLGRMRLILRRIDMTVQAAIAAKPDLLLTIDSPDFGLRVAARVRKAAPNVPTMHWVCPSVWAWRPWRARKMRPYIDRILALLPFEPKALAELKGPPTRFVGHPLIEQLGELRPSGPEAELRANAEAPTILLLPGSRTAEIRRHLPLFGQVAARLAQSFPQAHFVLPTVPHLEGIARTITRDWPIKPGILTAHDDKRGAFRRARGALAASGTVTLELALAGVPTVAVYRVSGWEAAIARRVIRVPSVLLPNLILESRAVPEFLQQEATPDALTKAMAAIIPDGHVRSRQLDAFVELERRMKGQAGSPSEHVADEALDLIRSSRSV